MSLIIQNGKMEANGRADLKAPLLQPPDGVAIAVPKEKDHRDKKLKTIKLKIGDIKCSSCATSIESVLGELNGVERTIVSPLDGHAAISYIPDLVTVSQLDDFICVLIYVNIAK